MCRTFAVLLLLLTGPTLAGAQTRVQHASSDRFNLDPTGFSVAYGSPVTLGNTEIVLVRSLSAGADVVTSVTATRATLALIVSDVSHDPLLYLYAGAITSSGAETVSATWTTADPNYVWMAVIEVAGASATADGTPGHVATTGATDQVCSALTTSGPGYVVMGASEAATNTYTAGTDSASHLWTLLNGSIGTTPNFFGGVQDYLAAGSLSAVTPHITSSDGSATYTTVCAAFPAITGGARSSLSLLGVGRP